MARMRRTIVSAVAWIGGSAALLSVPSFMSQGTAFKIGLVLLFYISALGLHLLVNWAGELSLAHGTVLGLSCLAVGKLSGEHQVNAIALTPVGILVGAACGGVMALAAFRAKGFYVAIVTLALSVVTNAYLFRQEWLVGTGSVLTAVVPFSPWRLLTPQDMYPVLVLVAVASTSLFVALSRSKYRRAWLAVKSNPAVAANQGIPVQLYRAAAYVIAGGMAGLAGGLTAAWVGAVSPSTFPQQLSFTYLIAVVLAGAGSLFALAEMVILLQGFQVFVSTSNPILVYLGPVGFILTLTMYSGGLSEQNRATWHKTRRWWRQRRPSNAVPRPPRDHPQTSSPAIVVKEGANP